MFLVRDENLSLRATGLSLARWDEAQSPLAWRFATHCSASSLKVKMTDTVGKNINSDRPKINLPLIHRYLAVLWCICSVSHFRSSKFLLTLLTLVCWLVLCTFFILFCLCLSTSSWGVKGPQHPPILQHASFLQQPHLSCIFTQHPVLRQHTRRHRFFSLLAHVTWRGSRYFDCRRSNFVKIHIR